jgi:hypothetical protein
MVDGIGVFCLKKHDVMEPTPEDARLGRDM